VREKPILLGPSITGPLENPISLKVIHHRQNPIVTTNSFLAISSQSSSSTISRDSVNSDSQSVSQSYITTDGQSVSLSWNKAPIWDLTTRFLLLSDNCWFVYVGRSLWREDGSVVYSCSWPLPAQTFSGPTPMGLVTIIYCLRFETSLFVASCDSQGYGGGIRPRLHTGLWFSATWGPHYIASGRSQQETPFPNNSSIVIEVCLPRRCIETVVLLLLPACTFPQELFTGSLPSNERLLGRHYPGLTGVISQFQPMCHTVVENLQF
jgi:hypothetical protein